MKVTRSFRLSRRSVRRCRAFSLVEMLVVVTIIAIVAALALPSIGLFQDGSKVIATAADLRTFSNAFRAYGYLEGGYPPDSHNAVPTGVGMEDYLAPVAFERESPIGGRYNWEGPDNYSYVGISLTTTSASTEQLEFLDEKLDDGDLSTGLFRQMPNGRYTYILEEF